MLLLIIILSVSVSQSATTYYEVWRNTIDDPTTAGRIAQWLTATNYDDYDVVDGQHYYYWIRALSCEKTEKYQVVAVGVIYGASMLIPVRAKNEYFSPIKTTTYLKYNTSLNVNGIMSCSIRESDGPLWQTYESWETSIVFNPAKDPVEREWTHDIDISYHAIFGPWQIGDAEVYFRYNFDGRGFATDNVDVTIHETSDPGPTWQSISQGEISDKIHLSWNSTTDICSEIDYNTLSAEGWTGGSPYVYFADANLKSVIKQALGMATDPTENDMLILTDLDAGNKSITDIAGLEYAINLTTLNLSGNQLTSIPESFGNLTNLTELSIYNNPLTNLPESFGNLTNLTGLLIYRNPLTTIPESFGNLTNLTGLYIEGTQLTSLPESLGNLTNLTELYILTTPLTSLPESLGNLTNLMGLYIDGNQLNTDFYCNLLPVIFANNPTADIQCNP